MSTLKVNNIQNASGTDAISIGSDGSLSYPNIGRRNLVINGAMQVAQRGTSFSSISSTQLTLDRWYSQYTTTSARMSVTQESAGGPPGFNNFLRAEVATSAAITDPNDLQCIKQVIEGYNISYTNQGTADAETLTCSFWTRSSVAGTYAVALYLNSSGTTYTYPVEYTINATNTWEYKTVTFAPQTTSASWVSSGYTNGEYAQLRFGLMAGSNRASTSGSWQSTTNIFGASGQDNLFATSGATWDLTGVQLEVGSVATPFEHRSYGEELALCQRYYQEFGRTGYMSCRGNGTTAVADALIPTSTVLRATPTITGGSWYATKGSGTTLYAGSGETYSVQSTSSQGVVVDISNIANMTDNMVAVIQVLSVTLDAEL